MSKDIHHHNSQGDPECPHPPPKCGTHLEAPSHIQALGQAGTSE